MTGLRPTVAALVLLSLAAPAAAGPPPQPEETLSARPRKEHLAFTVFLQQNAMFISGSDVTSGGLGGGVGAQVAWQRRYLAQVDLDVLWLVGTPLVTRLAVGVQRDGGWTPALWATANALWGGRIEMLDQEGGRPPAPSWGVGLRASPLRFTGGRDFVSALEAGAAVDFDGCTWLELTLLQVGTAW